MENNERNIIVSKFEVIPYNPIEFYHLNDERSVGEIIVNKTERLISFKLLSGCRVNIEIVLLTMFCQKHWYRIINEELGSAEFKNLFLLVRGFLPREVFVARREEDVDAVIDHKIKSFDLDIDEITLTPLEFILLFDYFDEWSCLFPSTSRRKQVLRWIRKELEFRFIK